MQIFFKEEKIDCHFFPVYLVVVFLIVCLFYFFWGRNFAANAVLHDLGFLCCSGHASTSSLNVCICSNRRKLSMACGQISFWPFFRKEDLLAHYLVSY